MPAWAEPRRPGTLPTGMEGRRVVLSWGRTPSDWVLERTQGAGWIGSGDQRPGEESGGTEA